MVITDLETFLIDNNDKIFRFLVYRRMFTPYELDFKAVDESFFEDTTYSLALIEEAIDLGYGEWLIGFRPIDDYTHDAFDTVEYYKLSEIRLSYFECDQNLFKDEEEVEEND